MIMNSTLARLAVFCSDLDYSKMKFGGWNNLELPRKQAVSAALRQEPIFAESLDEFDHAKEA